MGVKLKHVNGAVVAVSQEKADRLLTGRSFTAVGSSDKPARARKATAKKAAATKAPAKPAAKKAAASNTNE